VTWHALQHTALHNLLLNSCCSAHGAADAAAAVLLSPQARVIASWYASSAGAQRLGFAKLWLFDNALGDAAAAALAPLIGKVSNGLLSLAAIFAIIFLCTSLSSNCVVPAV
jgi:hypothetical protein